MKKLGYKDLEELVLFGLSIPMAVAKSSVDGWDWSDAVNFLPVIRKAPAAIGGITDVPAQLADLDAEEKAALHKTIQEEFEFPDEVVEGMVEDGLKMAINIASIVARALEAKKSTDEAPDAA